MKEVIAAVVFVSILAVTAIVLAFKFAGNNPSEETKKVGFGETYTVEKLFTYEGCTVYRFNDHRTVYYTNCNGETQSSHSCGKNCTATDNVSTSIGK